MTPAERKRRRARWLAGSPAALALVAGAGLVTWLFAAAPAGRADWYPDAADAAFEAGDYHQAAVCYARLQQLHPDDVATTFSLARSLDAIGQVDAARSLLLRIAPPDAAGGYVPAHLRIVRQDLSPDRPSDAAMADAQRHLGPVLRAQPADPEVNFWVAILCADRGRWDLVDPAAGVAASLRDVLAPRLAQIAKAQGNAAKAEQWSRAAGGSGG